MGIAVPGSIGIRLRLLSELRSEDLRGDCSKPKLPRREESGTDFFGLALHPRRSRVLGCHCLPHLEVRAKPQKRVTIAPSGRLTRNRKSESKFPIIRLSRNLLISPFKSRNRPGQVPGTSDASKTQSGLIRVENNYACAWLASGFGNSIR